MPHRPPPRRRILAMVPTHRSVGRGVMRGLAVAARQYGWVVEHDLAYPPRRRTLERLAEADGILAVTGKATLASRLRKTGKPCVLILSPPTEGLECYQADNVEAGRLAGEHLIRLGYRHLGWFGSDRFGYEPDRRRGLIEAARAGGVAVSLEDSSRRLEAWLEDLPKPAGVLSPTDDDAGEVIAAAHDTGLNVPGEIGVAGIENEELVCTLCEPEVTSVDLGTEQVALAACARLEGLMDGQPARPATHVVSACHLAQRTSTDLLACENPAVRRAVAFIRQYATEGIDVSDVAAEAGVGRRRLSQLFAEHLGRTVLAEITDTRLQLARKLLRETDMPITRIALRCGYQTPSAFAETFGRHTQETPRAYRARVKRI